MKPRHATALLLATLAAASGGWILAAAAGDATGPAVLAKLKALRPDLPVQSVSAAPVPGMSVIELSGGTMLYATNDGRYLIAGDLYELKDDELVNLAEARRDGQRKELVAAVPLEEMAIFPATTTRKAAITVFTDVDCGYCRKLHQEVPELNRLGIEVRYLAYPRQGIGSAAYEKMVSAWCSSDRNDAITRLKRGETILSKTCTNPVEQQYLLGQEIGVSGTPAIVFESGRMQPGYTPADQLAAAALQ